MTVMLLQRFAAPQPTYVIKNIKHTCDYEADTGLKTTPIIFSHENNDNQYQIQEQKKINDTIVTNIDSHYCNNIKKQNNNNNNKSNNNNTNNNNNNIINITVNRSEKEKLNNVTNSCKDDKFPCTNSYYLGKTTTNNTSNNYNNNNNNNNNNININNNEAVEEEEEELLVRDKFSRRQETITSNTTVITTGTAGTSATSASQGRFFGQGVAMRYYRLWIYACNIVLLGSALGFAAAVLRTFVFSGDPRRFLVPGVPHAFDPTALYAYLALATQLGLVQLLGCIAARRLSARLLNIYWLLLLALLFGDVIIGVAWVFRYERMRAELRPALKLKLQVDYNKESRFSYHWDRLQRDFSCCGVTGPSDFDSQFLPQTCCPDTISNDYGISSSGIDIISDGSNNIQTLNANETNLCRQPFANGCEDYLMHWLRKSADLLFVVGFCVVAFAKLCFLGILRYEIREMIQKIRLLREPPPPASSQFIQSFCQGVQATPITTAITSSHGSSAGLGNATPTMTAGDITSNNIMCNYGGSRRTTLPIVVSSSTVTNNPSNFGNNVALLPQQLSQDYGNKHSLLYTSNLQQDTGADSDTNSHCALILEETTPTPTARNCNSTREKSNGNNNYEMHEFNSRYLLSNGASPQTGIKVVGQNRRT